MKDLHNLLIQVSIINKKNNEILDATGGRFNMFRLLGVNHYENTHSSILAEFLNPNGSHGLKSIFLKSFIDIEVLGDFSEVFDFNGSTIQTEAPTGNGRIDILIEDSNGHAIIIENKIYAVDQWEQLKRYNEFGLQKYGNGNYKIFYLTLYGTEASEHSRKDVEYIQISYASHIIIWLEHCVNLSSRFPLVRETINQYINHIKHLTGQSNSTKMKDEIIELLLSNSNYIDSAQEIIKALKEINEKVYSDFFSLLKEKAGEPILLKNNNRIIITNGEDAQGVYLGFSLKDHEDNQISVSEIGKHYSDILKKIHPRMYKNQWHIGWFCPTPFEGGQRFPSLDQKLRIEMYANHDKLIEFVDKLINQKDRILFEFLKEVDC